MSGVGLTTSFTGSRQSAMAASICSRSTPTTTTTESSPARSSSST
jgi:hypothetical protein